MANAPITLDEYFSTVSSSARGLSVFKSWCAAQRQYLAAALLKKLLEVLRPENR